MIDQNNPMFGKHHTIEAKEKIRQKALGRKHTTITKIKIGLASKGRINLGTRKKWSLERRIKFSFSKMGKKSNNWQGGISPLANLIRGLIEYKIWTKLVLQRDHYICQECFKNSRTLVGHHIKAFSIIFKEFLKQYSQFSPIEDKETLVRLAITYAPFWDINNGKTLCKECHKLTSNYKNLKTQPKESKHE